MAQPTPFFVTPSTTVVQVPTLQIPYTPVILNAYSYAGQTVTVLDATSSFGVLYSSIVVSTATTASYTDGSISTLINQPQGFVTLQAQLPNTWAFLNSYPFRNQYLSAGLYSLTASSFTAASFSSLQQIIAGMTVENLTVSGNFNQSSPLILNQTVSTFGSVDLYSTVRVYESALFSSGLSTLGAVSLFSTLRVGGNLETRSSLQFLSSVFVSTSISVKDFVSAGSVQISGGLATYRLIVTHSSFSSIQTAGSLFVSDAISSFSSLRIGSNITAKFVTAQSFSTLSSMAIAGSIVVQQSTVVAKHLSTQGALNVFQTLQTGDMTVTGQVTGQSNLTVGEGTTIHGFLSTSQLRILSARVGQAFQVDPTQTSVVNADNVQVSSFVTFVSFTARSTTIGGILSTTANAVFQNDLQIRQFFSSPGSVSTTGDFFVHENLTVTSLSSFGSMAVVSSCFLPQDLTVASTFFWNQLTTPQVNSIRSTLSITGSLQVSGSLVISSIVLPSSVVANNFFVSSLFVGDKAIVSSSMISSIRASSIGTGGISRPECTMDMSNTLETPFLSTVLFSSLQFQAKSDSLISTFFQVTSSFGVGHVASTNTLDVNVLAYSLCNLFVSKTVSTQGVFGGLITGTFQGDGSLLSNTAFPKQVSTAFLTVSSVQALTIVTSSLVTSTLTLQEFIPTSTFTAGGISLFGNASSVPLLSTPYIATILGSNNQLNLNGFLALGKNSGQYDITEMQGAIINPDKFPGLYSNNNGGVLSFGVPLPGYLYKSLIVGDTLRVDSLKDYAVENFELRADRLLLNESVQAVAPSFEQKFVSFLNNGTSYISSGRLLLEGSEFFLPEGFSQRQPSTNTIEPYGSTLMFNSTLFVNRGSNTVGINVKEPFYTLDVYPSVYAPSSFTSDRSTIVQNQVRISQSNNNYWLGYGERSEGVYTNIRYSQDANTWTDVPFLNPDYNEIKIYSLVNDGGILTVGNGTGTGPPAGFLTAPKRWVLSGALCNAFTGFQTFPQLIFSDNPFGDWTPATFITPSVKFYPYERKAAEFNGSYWVGTGINYIDQTLLNNPRTTLYWSDTGESWEYANSGGFDWDIYVNYSGGRSLAWNGYLWVTVGIGNGQGNSILYSGDRSNWSNAANGFITDTAPGFNYSGGFGVVWTGVHWVAVGNTNGSPGILYSSTATTWAEVGGTGFNILGRAVGWNGSRLVAAGENTYGSGSMVYSDNHGVTWNVCQGNITTVTCNIAWNGSYWLAATMNGVRQSQDGITWSNPSGVTYPFYGTAYNSNLYPSLAIGTSTLQYASTLTTSPGINVVVGNGSPSIYSSADGINWTAGTNTFSVYGGGVNFDGATWVAVGSNAFGYNILYSTDATTWTTATFFVVQIGAGNDVLYAGGKWIGAFDTIGESMYYSTDGQYWNPALGTQFTLAAYGIGYGPVGSVNKYLAVGEDTSPAITLYSSSDGVTWSDPSPSGFFTNRARDILYAGGIWLAAGGGPGDKGLRRSTDGTNWGLAYGSITLQEGYGVAYNGSNRWVAVGYTTGSGETMFYSDDGINWNAVTSGEFSVRGRGIAFNVGLQTWFATGDWNTTANDAVRYSGDGLNWSNTSGTAFTSYGSRIGTSGSAQLTKQTYYNQVRMYNNPLPGATGKQVTPYFASYPSTTLDLNNAITIDANQNVIIQNYGVMQLSQSPQSLLYSTTFFNQKYTYVSTLVSTPSFTLTTLNAQVV